MNKQRVLFFLAFGWLAIVFNVERINLFHAQPINLDTLVYVLAFIVSLLVMTVPQASKQNKWLIAALLPPGYIALGLLLRHGFTERPSVNLILEVVILEVTTYILLAVGRALLEYDHLIETFILEVHGVQMLPTTQGAEEINQELYRARRFERPVALVYCEFPPASGVSESFVSTGYWSWRITATFKRRFQQVELGKVVTTLTYKSDIVVIYKDGIVVCLPETNLKEAWSFTHQLNEMGRSRFGTDLHVGIAAFPDDGLVFENLVEVARRNLAAPELAAAETVEAPMVRTGDVWVDTEQRLKMAEDAAWLHKIAPRSYTARRTYLLVKRIMDFAVVMMMAPLLVPLMAFIGLLIFLEDGGSIFYGQQRTGYAGKRFKMYKFRTMIMNAQPIPAQKVVLADGTTRYMWPDKLENDPRITRVGRFLRKTSLDEIPQLLNVLRGDMSLVGPRPTSWDVDKYTLHQTERLSVRPGLTGLWQVCARETKNFDERLLWDMRYIDKISFWLDVQILWRTATEVFKKGGV